ncbi:MAG TPA: M23 family metallopeptidase [Thermoanaerobacterales bacterium]|nr:M23 family metallopeptidase [Thermoanaerobacterales bacterium]
MPTNIISGFTLWFNFFTVAFNFTINHQKNILKAYGLSEDEIANIDLQTIRDTLRNGTIVDSSWFGDEPKYGTNDIPSHLEKIIASKNLSDRQMKGLRQRGYTYEEIAEMDNKTIESIVGSVSLLSASNANPPEGYQYVAEVPDGGGTNEYFHPDVSVTTNQLNWYVSASKEFTKHIYNMSSNPPIGTYSYYLYGEWDGVTVDPLGEYDGIPGGTHEGVDVKHTTAGKTVISATEGVVIRCDPGGSLDGYVQIYDDYLNETITYMHVSNTELREGHEVDTETVLGIQSKKLNHVHFQAYDAENTSIPSGKDDVLYCRIPYGFMTWYL